MLHILLTILQILYIYLTLLIASVRFTVSDDYPSTTTTYNWQVDGSNTIVTMAEDNVLQVFGTFMVNYSKDWGATGARQSMIFEVYRNSSWNARIQVEIHSTNGLQARAITETPDGVTYYSYTPITEDVLYWFRLSYKTTATVCGVGAYIWDSETLNLSDALSGGYEYYAVDGNQNGILVVKNTCYPDDDALVAMCVSFSSMSYVYYSGTDSTWNSGFPVRGDRCITLSYFDSW